MLFLETQDFDHFWPYLQKFDYFDFQSYILAKDIDNFRPIWTLQPKFWQLFP